MAKHRVKLILLILIFAGATGIWRWQRPPQTVPVQELALPSPAPVLTAVSADGEINLALTQEPNADATSWTLSAGRGGRPQPIWTATLANDTDLELPFNAVSPDNKYLFLKQTGPDQTRYLVFPTTGNPLQDGEQFWEFAEAFADRFPEFKIDKVTGWGGINLIIINTKTRLGTAGPSFWFEVPTQKFIRLSNRF